MLLLFAASSQFFGKNLIEKEPKWLAISMQKPKNEAFLCFFYQKPEESLQKR